MDDHLLLQAEETPPRYRAKWQAARGSTECSDSAASAALQMVLGRMAAILYLGE